jgi:glycosyltransferase involved in cell wall biosynthesis
VHPFFSIIIPTYNRAAFIAQAIETVLIQTFKDFEVIVVDDGSTDQTAQMVRTICDSRVRYFKKENQERSIARNFGIAHATGKYINFLDSDDRFYPHHLKTAYRLLSSNNFPEVGHLGFESITSDGRILFQQNNFDEHLPQRMIRENIMHCNAIFIRKDVALKYTFIQSELAVISEDWYVWMRLLARFKIHFDNTITSSVVEHQHRSLNQINVDKLIASTEMIVAELKKDVEFKRVFLSKMGCFFADQYTLVTLLLALNKDKKEKIYYYLRKAILEDASVILRKRFLASVKYMLFPSLVKATY